MASKKRMCDSEKTALRISCLCCIFLFTILTNALAFPALKLGSFRTVPGVISSYQNFTSTCPKDRLLVCQRGAFYTVYCKEPKGKKTGLVELSPAGCLSMPTFLETFSKGSFAGSKHACPAKRLHPRKPEMQAKHKWQGNPYPRFTKEKPTANTFYSDLSNPNIRKYLSNAHVVVLPEVTTKVLMSNRDVNRIVCLNGPVKDVVFSQEKNMQVKIKGKNVFVKYLFAKDPVTGETIYSKIPSELYVICGNNVVYSLITLPANIPAQEVQLYSKEDKIKKTLSLFKGMPLENKVVMLIKDAYTDTIPDYLTVKRFNRPLNLFQDINITLRRTVTAEGEGLKLKEYVLSLKPQAKKPMMRLKEQFFLIPELAEHPIGISLSDLLLRKGSSVRLFIVEKHYEE